MPIVMQPVSNWKKGDKALFEHKQVTITDVEDGHVWSVSDGMFSTSGNNLTNRLFPLSDKGLEIAKTYEDWYNSLYKLAETMNLNWPDISGHTDDMFEESMRMLIGNGGETSEGLSGSLLKAAEFFAATIAKINFVKNLTVDGIQIFIRR